MKLKRGQSGLTLTEMTVVIAVVALLTVLSLPAVRAFFVSLADSGNARPMISAALASARAIAAKEQRYAGIRFQTAYDPKGPLDAPQYMIFIINEEPRKIGNIRTGFRAVEGLEPMKLPNNVGVMDLHLGSAGSSPNEVISSDGQISTDVQFTDATAFSIIFSPSGKMVIHDVRTRNRDGFYQPDNSGSKFSMDDVFNSPINITNYHAGMFVQDDYANLGLDEESSRNSFIIYERDKFKAAYKKGQAWSDYLVNVAPIYINPYTGTMINK